MTMIEKDVLDIPMIATVGIVSVVLTVATIIGVQALYHSYASFESNRKVILAPNVSADSKLAEQDAKLAKYGWANREKGQVIVPIDRAMSAVVASYRDADGNIFAVPEGSASEAQ